MSSHILKNPVNSYDSNGVIAVPISTLGDEKRFRIDGAILEISFTNLSLRGGMKSEPLTKPSGSLCGDERLLWMSLKILEQGEQRYLLESNTEVQRKPGHHKAGSCFHHISSSILWILVKLGTYGKLFSRGI